MALPLSRFGVRGASASTDTVAGMVTSQNIPAAITAKITAAITSLRSIGATCPVDREMREGGASCRRPPSMVPIRQPLRGSLAVGLVATATILAHLSDLNLEGLEVLGRVRRRLRLAGKFGELGLEIRLVLPDRRQCRGVAAGLRRVGEERGRLLARRSEERR